VDDGERTSRQHGRRDRAKGWRSPPSIDMPSVWVRRDRSASAWTSPPEPLRAPTRWSSSCDRRVADDHGDLSGAPKACVQPVPPRCWLPATLFVILPCATSGFFYRADALFGARGLCSSPGPADGRFHHLPGAAATFLRRVDLLRALRVCPAWSLGRFIASGVAFERRLPWWKNSGFVTKVYVPRLADSRRPAAALLESIW